MIEYICISGIVMCLFIVMLLLVNSYFISGPTTNIMYSAFTDIGNGVSTRIVDVYAIAPDQGNITSSFDLPDDIVGQSYSVEIIGDSSGQTVDVMRDLVNSSTAIAGVGGSTHGRSIGNTTGAGVNTISYDSSGFT